MKLFDQAVKLRKSATRMVINEIPTRVINAGYNTYSRIYKEQLSLGLPVSRELILNQREIKTHAVGKLALTLFHMFQRASGKVIPRDEIKNVLMDELAQGRINLTEQVILLTTEDLNHLSVNRFGIAPSVMDRINAEAHRRFILKESLKFNPQPAYFESEINERENNGRGDYETVFYREFTHEGKEIRFRRLVSMEEVTAGDHRPSMILVPGFANNSNCFDMTTTYSIAMDLADAGVWVYMFDPRGMGVNTGRLDPYYTVDTLIDYDLPAVLRFTYSRSCGKPSILMGHSMGGMVSENMVLNWALRLNFDTLRLLSPEEKKILDNVLPSSDEAVANIEMVKGIISLGSPKFFNKKSHVFFPTALWLNHLSRIFNMSHIPIHEISKVITNLPVLKEMTRAVYNNNIGELNFLISPENHKTDKFFIETYLKIAMESIPLGLGFQLLRAVYDGTGFKRMDESNLNYSDCFSYFPEHIPLFHFWGGNDHLAPVDNMKYSEFYPHKRKKIYRLETMDDLKRVEIVPDGNQLIDFVIEGAGHIDLLYGKAAIDFVYPLIEQIIETVWGDWNYDQPTLKECTIDLDAG